MKGTLSAYRTEHLAKQTGQDLDSHLRKPFNIRHENGTLAGRGFNLAWPDVLGMRDPEWTICC
jgi:hypothetical protein